MHSVIIWLHCIKCDQYGDNQKPSKSSDMTNVYFHCFRVRLDYISLYFVPDSISRIGTTLQIFDGMNRRNKTSPHVTLTGQL